MEIDLTVLLNLKCEEIQDIGTTILAVTEDKFQNRNLPKYVELNSLCKFYQVHYPLYHLMSHISLNEPFGLGRFAIDRWYAAQVNGR